ncbi:hypothetical protein SUGI_0400030 [Cryptomeria japonica]|nr:hypothetical protein SUGI_0400030 [Cryptomeria japonica]
MREEWRNQLCDNGGLVGADQFKPSKIQVRLVEDMSDLVEIDLSDEIIEDLDLWEKLAVICKVVGPKMERKIKSWIDEHWHSKMVAKFTPKGFFIVIFTEEDEKDKIMQHGNWFLDNHPIYMQPWFPNFDLVTLAYYEKPIWIRLYNLMIEYWGESNLDKIGRTLGTLLEIDENVVEKDSYLYARIKFIAVKKVPAFIHLKSEDIFWSQ